MLSHSNIVGIECMFVLIDTGAIPHDVSERFMQHLFYTNSAVDAYLNWLLTRWVLLGSHKFHLPKHRRSLNLTNLINCNGT